jgi:uncharacterized protein DUF4399
MASRIGVSVALAAMALYAAACGSSSSTPPESSSSAPAADASHTGHTGAGRVFFVEPKDGDTIKPEAHLVFGSEQFTISPVPAGDVKEVRPGTGHYHVAVDSDCLPTGEVIPKADPWIHFGKGDNSADLQLKPGPHKLTVQAGDDQHRTVEGLCQTISVTVAGK